MELDLFKSSLRTFLVRILKIEGLLVLAHLISLTIFRLIYWRDPCTMENIPCYYEGWEVAFSLLAFISKIAFFLTHAVAIVLSVRQIANNPLGESRKLMWRDALLVGFGMPLVVAIVLFSVKPSMRMTELVKEFVEFVENVRR